MPELTTERRVLRAATLPIRIEDRADKTPVVSGYAAVFYRAGAAGTEFDWFGMRERIMPGTFDRAIREDDVRALFNHDANLVLGRTGPKTLRLSVDATGLRYEIDPPDTQAGRDVVASIRRGDVSGSSFGFAVTDEDIRKENDVWIREIRGVRLYDVSPVTFPAYEGTTAEARAAKDRIDGVQRRLAEAEEARARIAARGRRARTVSLDEPS